MEAGLYDFSIRNGKKWREGKAEGKAEGKIEAIRNAIKDGLTTLADVKKSGRYTEEEIAAIAAP